MENKRGSVIDIIIFIVFAFVSVTFLGLWAYGFNEVTSIITTIDVNGNTALNISGAGQDTFGQVNNAYTNWLPILSFVLIFGSMLTIFISNFLVKVHPVFFVVYLLVNIVAVIISVYISNAYEDLLTNSIYGATFSSWTATSYLMVHLPIWVTIVGIFGAVFLFSNIINENQGGGIA